MRFLIRKVLWWTQMSNKKFFFLGTSTEYSWMAKTSLPRFLGCWVMEPPPVALEEIDEAEELQTSRHHDPAASIEDIFRCPICLGRVHNAQMCPFCSKMCCYTCITVASYLHFTIHQYCFQKWLVEQRPQCPHCRASLHVEQLVQCRFVAEVSSVSTTFFYSSHFLIAR
jgi:hypothetical protein